MLKEENEKTLLNVLEQKSAIKVIAFIVYPLFTKHYAICGSHIKIYLPYITYDDHKNATR